MNRDEKLQKLERLKWEVEMLENEIDQESKKTHWTPSGYYATFHVLAGMMLGFFGAASSLLFNMVGSMVVKQHPLELIRVFLTFPLGEKALHAESGVILALGCCLYLGTGMFYGSLFHVILSRFFSKESKRKRFLIASLMGIALWMINFYGILSWLQPLAFDGDWIVRLVPFWVAALTHLVFAWTMLLVDEWGYFDKEGHLAQP